MGFRAYKFAEFRLDPARRELWRRNDEVALPPKAFGCLVYLVENRDRAVGRDELIDAVWGKENLGDSVLGHAILAARRALEDTGDEHRFIKTVQGFGYRWVAPVQEEAADEPTATGALGRRRSAWLLVTLAILTVVALTLWTIHLWRVERPRNADGAGWEREEGDIALLLPVTVEPEEDNRWIRLGVMELIAERLREAGQPMVPSETVLALTQGLAAEPGPQALETLSATTGSRLLLRAHAEATGTRWRVSVQGLNGDPPRPTAFAEADDVLEAARLAADRMALSLGLPVARAPRAEGARSPDADPGLGLLLRQTEAAMLAQRMDVARRLIEAADVELRRRPELRLQSARIALSSHRLDAARSQYESLLAEPSVRRAPTLRARVLQGLSIVHFQRGDHQVAESLMEEAMESLGPADTPPMLGAMHKTLGSGAVMRGELEAARRHLAQARIALEATGDARRLAGLDNNRGVLETLCERYAEALSYFERAADLFAALHDLGEELRARANMIEMQLGLLDPRAASTVEPRLSELLARTTNPEMSAVGDLARADLLEATGSVQAAEDVITGVLDASEGREDLVEVRTWALVRRAEQLAREGDFSEAVEPATAALDLTRQRNDVLLDDSTGRAWLVLLRASLAERDLQAASEVAAELSRWAKDSPTGLPRIYAALARAEAAAAAGQAADAATAFERAFALADSGRVPLRILQVAESYVPWLLSGRVDGRPRAEHALAIVDRLTRYADQDFRAARLQLLVYHALGPPSAWRSALSRARALAGEHEIPPQLLIPPAKPQDRHGKTIDSTRAADARRLR